MSNNPNNPDQVQEETVPTTEETFPPQSPDIQTPKPETDEDEEQDGE